METILKSGQEAPDFLLQDKDGEFYSLDNFQGHYLVLYFYPKDLTSGCTIEAKDFSKLQKEFGKESAIIVGISKDSIQSHQQFTDKAKLSIFLFSDPQAEVHKKYGVWQPRKFMGREFLGTVRSTFLIDPNGKILEIWNDVKVKGHAEEVLKRLKEMKR
ncbi:hypothetical protein A2335_04740 [Candidatus Peregrinibacteria bacterium RIFOXYB2_FULL_32_7]|nr:MAG: hypothetical protein A2335_04740 [Candidatus Peregrinibacteria bacterium RIFOXYB2_FULL_32_7]